MFDGGACLLELPCCIVEILLRERVLRGERLGASQVGLGHFHGRLLTLQRCGCCIDLRLERLLIHLEQNLPSLDHRAFDVDALLQKTGDACLDVDRL